MRHRSLSHGIPSVIVVGVDTRVMGLIRECLGTEAAIAGQVTSYDDAVTAARKARANVAIVGLDLSFDDALRLGNQFTQELPGLQLVAIAEKTDPDRIRAAMRAKYREYVVLPEDASLLRQRVKEASATEPEDASQGEVIAVVGSKGGCGVTFLAIHLAAEVSQLERVCVVDLDFSMGDVAAFLDVQPTSSIQDVLKNLDRLDERFLAGSVAVHPSKLHVLAQPTELLATEEVKGEDVLRVLSACADAYNYVLVDCGGRLDEATLTASSVADLIFLVCTPDVPSVKNAWRRLQLMDRLSINRDAIRLIVNKWERTSDLSTKDIETNLGLPVSATIDYDPVACRKAINAGRLLRDIDRKSPTARDISEAVTLVTEHAQKVDKKATSSGLRRFFFK